MFLPDINSKEVSKAAFKTKIFTILTLEILRIVLGTPVLLKNLAPLKSPQKSGNNELRKQMAADTFETDFS